MKTINFIMIATLVVTGFAACKNETTEAEQDAMSLTSYVDSVNNLTPVYTSAYWASLDNGYQIRLIRSDKTIATLNASDKEKLEESKARYAALRSSYIVKINENEVAVTTPDYRQVLRNNLFGEGMIGSDLKFGFVTANNLLSVFRTFVNTVADNRNRYTREDWDEIKVLYEALDTRKNAVEKELPKGDNLKIAGLKIKFSTIKATHRGGTKAAENKEAKQ